MSEMSPERLAEIRDAVAGDSPVHNRPIIRELLACLADAWGEGYDAGAEHAYAEVGHDDYNGPEPVEVANPYRLESGRK